MLYQFLTTFLLAGFLSLSQVFASSPFAVDRQLTYTIGDDLIATVEEQITIENLTTESYPKEFFLLIDDSAIANIFIVDEQGEPLQWTSTLTPDNQHPQTKIKIFLSPQLLGKDKTVNFKLLYDLPKAVNERGRIRNIELPQLVSNSFDRHLSVYLKVTSQLGKPAYIAPLPEHQDSTNQEWQKFTIPSSELKNTGIRAIFGNFQIYNFQLQYHLANQTPNKQTQTITWPPDTAYQRVAITEVSQAPYDVDIDEDGNWLASYSLSPHTSQTITIEGQVMVFAEPWTDSIKPQKIKRWLVDQTYWEVRHPEIVQLSKTTPTVDDVYNFVVNKLQYAYQATNLSSQRQGAAQALQKPDQAICTEYTDTFVTLARAIGTPARQVIGYAYSENRQQQPLSLGGDILHAWPEYWSESQQHWQPVDPTWEATTGGTDYFSQWDLYHVALAINGLNSKQPLAAGFFKSENSESTDQRDVVFTLGSDFPPVKTDLKYDLQFIKNSKWLIGEAWQGHLVITNQGSTALSSSSIQLVSDHAEFTTDDKPQPFVIPPYGRIDLPFQMFPHQWPAGNIPIHIVTQQAYITLTTPKWLNWWQGVLLLALGGACVSFTIISYAITQKLRRLSIQKHRR